MKKLLIKELQPGMITAEDIFAIDGQLILPKKVLLTTDNIQKLDSFAIYSIKVEDEISRINSSYISPDVSYSYQIKQNPEFKRFKESFEKNVDAFKTSLNLLIEDNSSFDAENVLSQTLLLMHDFGKSISIMDMLIHMRDYDDSTYAHCVNVGIICNIFAGWLNWGSEKRKLATSCGLFHDVGKLKIPESIIKKPDRLTNAEFESIKRHPIEGYHLLDQLNLDDEIKNAALMHHEKCDGMGYPYGFTGDKITNFAKLVTIVDVYDAMTSLRIYRDPICPFKVIESFEKEGYAKYDVNMILTFLRNVTNSFIGYRVRLNNGLEGEIVFIHPEHLSRPTIRCGNKFLDLSVHKNIEIQSLI